MIEEIMPNKLKKRRVIFVEDNYWTKLEKEAFESGLSISEILREILRDQNGKKR